MPYQDFTELQSSQRSPSELSECY